MMMHASIKGPFSRSNNSAELLYQPLSPSPGRMMSSFFKDKALCTEHPRPGQATRPPRARNFPSRAACPRSPFTRPSLPAGATTERGRPAGSAERLPRGPIAARAAPTSFAWTASPANGAPGVERGWNALELPSAAAGWLAGRLAAAEPAGGGSAEGPSSGDRRGQRRSWGSAARAGDAGRGLEPPEPSREHVGGRVEEAVP